MAVQAWNPGCPPVVGELVGFENGFAKVAWGNGEKNYVGKFKYYEHAEGAVPEFANVGG